MTMHASSPCAYPVALRLQRYVPSHGYVSPEKSFAMSMSPRRTRPTQPCSSRQRSSRSTDSTVTPMKPLGMQAWSKCPRTKKDVHPILPESASRLRLRDDVFTTVLCLR